MDEPLDPAWEATLQKRGAENVRILLAMSPGTSAYATVSGLGDKVSDIPTRGYAERWVMRQEADRLVQQQRLQGRRDWWAMVTAVAAVMAAVLAGCAWLLPLK